MDEYIASLRDEINALRAQNRKYHMALADIALARNKLTASELQSIAEEALK